MRPAGESVDKMFGEHPVCIDCRNTSTQPLAVSQLTIGESAEEEDGSKSQEVLLPRNRRMSSDESMGFPAQVFLAAYLRLTLHRWDKQIETLGCNYVWLLFVLCMCNIHFFFELCRSMLAGWTARWLGYFVFEVRTCSLFKRKGRTKKIQSLSFVVIILSAKKSHGDGWSFPQLTTSPSISYPASRRRFGRFLTSRWFYLHSLFSIILPSIRNGCFVDNFFGDGWTNDQPACFSCLCWAPNIVQMIHKTRRVAVNDQIDDY